MSVGEVALLATRSQGKLRELRPLFAAAGIELITLYEAGIAEASAEDELEVFDTFEENALAKARYFHELTGRPTFADDSGIAVDALSGSGIPVAAVEGQTVNRRDAPARAVSDIEGNYQIAGLRAWEYQVWTLTPALVAEPTTTPSA